VHSVCSVVNLKLIHDALRERVVAIDRVVV